MFFNKITYKCIIPTSIGTGYHPLLLLQQMTLSELYDVKGQKRLAQKMYQELISKSSIVFGPNHDFVHHYKSLLNKNQ